MATEVCPGSNGPPQRAVTERDGYCGSCGRLVRLRWGRTSRHTRTVLPAAARAPAAPHQALRLASGIQADADRLGLGRREAQEDAS